MNSRIKELLDRLDSLEEELRDELRSQRERFHYQLEGTRVRFDQAVAEANARLRTGVVSWFRKASLRNVLSAPFIYSMLLPLVLLDLTVSIYQAVCFRLYRVPRVKRSDYVVIDRHYLSYLNAVEKLNCVYCGYANGVIAYVREITSRTEQYWCPIKHARSVPGVHNRYHGFVEYGDASDIEARLQKLRDQLRSEGAQ